MAEGLESAVLSCNALAMQQLRKDNFTHSLALLHRAQDTLRRAKVAPHKLLTITLNNLGCYYKKLGKLHLSLQCLTEALELPALIPIDQINLAGTHLNACAISSQVHQHGTALKHAYAAIALLQETELLDRSIDVKHTLAVAYHNAAIEHELLAHFGRASELYEKALQVSEEHVGRNSLVTQAILGNYNALMARRAPLKSASVKGYRGKELPSLKRRRKEARSFGETSTLDEINRPLRGKTLRRIELQINSLQLKLDEF